MSTRTDYSVAGGGGRGYVNVGGWNTTLTDRSTTQAEVPGIKRREGANVYIYGLQSNGITASGAFVSLAAPATDGNGTLISPIVFAQAAAGTDNPFLVKGITICSAPTATYGWSLVEGVTSGTTSDYGGATAGSPLCPATGAANTWCTCTATGNAWALTAMASAISGQIVVKLM